MPFDDGPGRPGSGTGGPGPRGVPDRGVFRTEEHPWRSAVRPPTVDAAGRVVRPGGRAVSLFMVRVAEVRCGEAGASCRSDRAFVAMVA